MQVCGSTLLALRGGGCLISGGGGKALCNTQMARNILGTHNRICWIIVFKVSSVFNRHD